MYKLLDWCSAVYAGSSNTVVVMYYISVNVSQLYNCLICALINRSNNFISHNFVLIYANKYEYTIDFKFHTIFNTTDWWLTLYINL